MYFMSSCFLRSGEEPRLGAEIYIFFEVPLPVNVSEYELFLNTHQTQLESLELPFTLWRVEFNIFPSP